MHVCSVFVCVFYFLFFVGGKSVPAFFMPMRIMCLCDSFRGSEDCLCKSYVCANHMSVRFQKTAEKTGIIPDPVKVILTTY